MMNYSKEVTDYIDNLNYHISDNIIDIQYHAVPHIMRDTRINVQNKYRYSDKIYKLANPDGMVILNVSLFPYSGNINNNPLFIDTMSNTLKKGNIRPFMLFLNGKFIKWSDITIVKDYSHTYLIVKFNELITSKYIVEIPCGVQYVENNIDFTRSRMSDDIELYFDIDGKFCTLEYAYTKIKLKSNNIILDTPIPKKIEFDNINEDTEPVLKSLNIEDVNNGNYNILISSNRFIDIETSKYNILHFHDGLLDTSIIYDESFIDKIGMGVYIFNKELDGENIFLVFGNTNVNKSLNYSSYIKMKNKLLEYLSSNDVLKFSLAYDICTKNKVNNKYQLSNTYEDNVSNLIKNITSQNYNILNELYKSRSLIHIEEYTGAELKKLLDGNFLKMHRRVYKGLVCGVMIFRNNRLYENYNTIKYENVKFSVLIDDINDDDKFEFLFIKYVKNNSSTIKISKDKPIKTSDYYDLENCSLFSIELENAKYPISSKDLVDLSTIKYEVPFKYEKVENSKNEYNVTLDDEFYYDRRLYISHNRQFRYCYYNINNDCLGVTLSPDFRFCHNIKKYMVFINGKLIPRDNVVLTIMDKDQPFDELSLYINITMHKGDIIEIFYMPMEINNILSTPNEIPESGIIEVDSNNLEYSLSRDLYLFFINGKKVHKSDLVDIDREKVQLINDIDTRIDLQIISHIVKDDNLYNLFNTSDSFNEFIDTIPNDVLNELFCGKENIISNTLEKVAFESIDMKLLRYEIYKNFFSEFSNSELEYTFNEDEALTENYNIDKGGNFIIRSSDTYEEKAELNRSDTNNGEEEKSHYGK